VAERKQNFAEGEFYHIYNRGVEKRLIFQDAEDYRHFLYLLHICNTQKSILLRDIGKKFDRGGSVVEIGAYCLMPNHFHILVREKTEGGITLFTRKVFTAYSMYFNKKYLRSGKLFENVFKAILVDSDEYLKYLYSYIHLNPAKIIDKDWRSRNSKNRKAFEYIFSYPYSSIQEYRNKKYYILNPNNFPGYFLHIDQHKTELYDWLNVIEKST
jgi:putative transposase